jgi:hypothetical protein
VPDRRSSGPTISSGRPRRLISSCSSIVQNVELACRQL